MPIPPKFLSKSGYILKGEDTHEQLMLAFREYFRCNEKWEGGTSDEAGMLARNALAIIRILARDRRKELQSLRKERMKKVRAERGKEK
jgi:hypothetical protein